MQGSGLLSYSPFGEHYLSVMTSTSVCVLALDNCFKVIVRIRSSVVDKMVSLLSHPLFNIFATDLDVWTKLELLFVCISSHRLEFCDFKVCLNGSSCDPDLRWTVSDIRLILPFWEGMIVTSTLARQASCPELQLFAV